MEIKIKKLDPNAVIPSKAHVDDAGFDLTAISKSRMGDGYGTTVYEEFSTGLAIEIPTGHAGFIFPRSSISKTKHLLANCVGVIDVGYLGEIKLRFRNGGFSDNIKEYEVGDRIGQLIILPLPEVTFTEVDELGDSERGEGGFGSSGQ